MAMVNWLPMQANDNDKVRDATPELLAAILKIRHALYVVGKPQAVKDAVAETTALLERFDLRN